MNHINIKVRTDADVADQLVQVPEFGCQYMHTGVFDAVPQPDRGPTVASPARNRP